MQHGASVAILFPPVHLPPPSSPPPCFYIAHPPAKMTNKKNKQKKKTQQTKAAAAAANGANPSERSDDSLSITLTLGATWLAPELTPLLPVLGRKARRACLTWRTQLRLKRKPRPPHLPLHRRMSIRPSKQKR